MVWSLIQHQLLGYQAGLSLWWTNHFCDTHDVMADDAMMHELLDTLNLNYDRYAPVPGFDYHDMEQSQWVVLIESKGRWSRVYLPNPLCSSSPDAESSDFEIDVRSPNPTPLD